jgi:hypothetical protein
MKRLLFTIAILLVLCSSGNAFFDAGVKDRILLSTFGGIGISFPWGEYNSSDFVERDIDLGYNAGISIAYPFLWWGGLICGVEYAYKPATTITSFSGGCVTETKTMRFINVLLGWRQYTWYLYYGTGVFGGFAIGPWSNRVDVCGTAFPLAAQGRISRSSRSHVFGIYTEIGFMFWFTDRISFDLGAQLQGTVNGAYRDRDSNIDSNLKPMLFVVKSGFTFKI